MNLLRCPEPPETPWNLLRTSETPLRLPETRFLRTERIKIDTDLLIEGNEPAHTAKRAATVQKWNLPEWIHSYEILVIRPV